MNERNYEKGLPHCLQTIIGAHKMPCTTFAVYIVFSHTLNTDKYFLCSKSLKKIVQQIPRGKNHSNQQV